MNSVGFEENECNQEFSHYIANYAETSLNLKCNGGCFCLLLYHCKYIIFRIHNTCRYLDYGIFWEGRSIAISSIKKNKPQACINCVMLGLRLYHFEEIPLDSRCLCLINGDYLCGVFGLQYSHLRLSVFPIHLSTLFSPVQSWGRFKTNHLCLFTIFSL